MLASSVAADDRREPSMCVFLHRVETCLGSVALHPVRIIPRVTNYLCKVKEWCKVDLYVRSRSRIIYERRALDILLEKRRN